MKAISKMAMMQARSDEPESRRDRNGRYAPRGEMHTGPYDNMNFRQEGPRYETQRNMPDNNDVENRFRDRTGREHYNNGRYAPMRNEMEDATEYRYNSPSMGGYGENSPRQMEYRHGDARSDEVPPIRDARTGYRYEDGNRMIGFYGGPEYRNDYRMDAGYQSKDEMSSSKSGHRQSGHASSTVRPMDRKTAHEWVQKMKNADGSTGEHWTYEQTTQVMKQRNMDCDPAEFYAIINAMWSDYGKVAEKYGINTVDFWAEMAKAFLMDKDAMPDKAALYYECIVK